MAMYSAQRPAPRPPLFSEAIKSSSVRQQLEEGPPPYREGVSDNNYLEAAKKKLREMALSMPIQTDDVPAKTEGPPIQSEETTKAEMPPIQREEEAKAEGQRIQSEEEAKTRSKNSASQATAGSSKMSEWKKQASLRPRLPTLSSNIYGDDLDIVFDSLPLRPEMKPICDMRKGRQCAHVPRDELDESPIYICLDCKDRAICEACIRDLLANPADPHRADHYLYPWKAKSSLQFSKFLWERRHGARLHFGPQEMFGREWLYSDHSFAPSSTGNLTVRFVLNAKPGTYYASVAVRTFVNPASISKDKLGRSKCAMIKAGMTWIGSLRVGMQTVDLEDTASPRAINKSLQRLPEKVAEQEVKSGRENEEVVSPLGTVQVFEGQAVEVSIRHWHDKTIFKRGSPFKWWLDSIT